MIARRAYLKRSTRPIARTAVKRVNTKRKESEFARAYHSKARVEFVKSLRCISDCGRPSQNAHIETGGTGRKADYRKIVPMCHYAHSLFHSQGRDAFERRYGVDLEALAAETELKWQAHLQGVAL